MFSSGGNVDPVKMPFIKLIFSPFSLFIDNLKKTFLLCLVFASILSVVSFMFGQAFICAFTYVQGTSAFCSYSPSIILINLAIKFAIFSAFIVKYHDASRDNGTLLSLFDRRIAKATFASFLIVLLFLSPMVSYFILATRVPNPDVMMELLFFTVVSIGFLIPLAVIRFFSVYGFISRDEVIPPLLFIWKRSASNNMVILSGLFFILFPMIFVMINFQAMFINKPENGIWYYYFISEFLYNMIILWVLSVFANHSLKQREFLKIEGEKNVYV